MFSSHKGNYYDCFFHYDTHSFLFLLRQIKNKTYNGNGVNREKAYEDAFASALVVIANDFISLSTSMPSNTPIIEDKCENEIETIADESYLIPDFIDNLCYGIDFNAKPQNSTVSFINVVTEVNN